MAKEVQDLSTTVTEGEVPAPIINWNIEVSADRMGYYYILTGVWVNNVKLTNETLWYQSNDPKIPDQASFRFDTAEFAIENAKTKAAEWTDGIRREVAATKETVQVSF